MMLQVPNMKGHQKQSKQDLLHASQNQQCGMLLLCMPNNMSSPITWWSFLPVLASSCGHYNSLAIVNISVSNSVGGLARCETPG